MPKVFVVERTKHDISQLHNWGDVVVLFGRSFYPDDKEERVLKSREILEEVLDYDPRWDYVVPVGDPVNLAIVTQFLVTLDKTPIHLLKYDRHHGDYYPVEI